MEGDSSGFGPFRVLDCYRRENIGTFTTHAGRLEMLGSTLSHRFVASRNFKADYCYEPIRVQSTTISGFGHAILIYEAFLIEG